MSAQTLRVRLSGERPLLMHSARLADPLDPITVELDRLTRKRDKTTADHEQISKVEWHGGLWLNDGKPCIPAEAIESAFVAAARTRRKGPGFPNMGTLALAAFELEMRDTLNGRLPRRAKISTRLLLCGTPRSSALTDTVSTKYPQSDKKAIAASS